jgi:hypothetical protein
MHGPGVTGLGRSQDLNVAILTEFLAGVLPAFSFLKTDTAPTTFHDDLSYLDN